MTSLTPPYEWIFSGIGVAILSWFGAWVYRRCRKAPPSEKSQVKISDSTVVGPVAGRDISIGTFVQHGVTDSANDEYRATPSTTEIAAAIRKVPFYLQASVAHSYSGLKVRWTARIKNVQVRDGLADSALGGSDEGPYIVFKVKLEDYPLLKTVRGGEPVEVVGTIDWVQENGMVQKGRGTPRSCNSTRKPTPSRLLLQRGTILKSASMHHVAVT